MVRLGGTNIPFDRGDAATAGLLRPHRRHRKRREDSVQRRRSFVVGEIFNAPKLRMEKAPRTRVAYASFP